MMLIEHEARVGLPRMWEHPRRTRTRRGGVVASMVGGYTAILLVRQRTAWRTVFAGNARP